MSLTLAQFSPGAGEQLAISTADGKLRIYSSSTGRLQATLGQGKEAVGTSVVTEGLANGHLTERHTCLAWAQLGGGRKEKKKKAASMLLLAGTAAGDVKAYNTQLGELAWRATGCIEGGITSLAFSSTQGLVYATGADCHICGLDVTSGAVQSSFKASKHPISCIALSPDMAHLFGGSSSLATWSTDTQERDSKFTGHPNPVRAIAYAPDGSHAASAGSGERSLALWPTSSAAAGPLSASASPVSVSGSGKKSKRKGMRAAVGSLPCPDPVVALDACASEPSNSSGPQDFHLAGLSETGDAYVWHCNSAPSTSGRHAEDGSEMEGQMLAHVRVDGSQGSGTSSQAQGLSSESILAVKLLPGTEGPVLLVARGTSARPAFQSIPLSQQHLQQQKQQHQPGSKKGSSLSNSEGAALFVLQASTGGVLLGSTTAAVGDGLNGGEKSGKAKLQHTKQDVTVLGPENQGAPMVVMGGAPLPGHKRKGAGEEEEQPVPLGERGDAEIEEDMDADEEEGVPLGERVAAMEAQAEGRPLGDLAAEGEEEAGPSGSNKTDSVAVLLTQALRSNDRVLLERCLATSNSRVIHNTVARIVPRDAALFLRAAVDRLLSRPARAGQLAPWLRALLHHHTGYLMAAPGAQAPLAALYQAIDGRVALYQQLLRLYGRLGLITAHSRKAGVSGDGEMSGVGPEPEVVFEDDSGDDDEEPEAEDPFALEGSGEGESSDGDEDDNEDDSMGLDDDEEDEDESD